MADLIRTPRTPVADPGLYPVVPVLPTDPALGGGLTRNTATNPSLVRGADPYANGYPGAVTTPVDASVPTGLPGSPLNTLYGVDSESYLTDEQKKLARQIQGKFDASLNSRDRALQRYGAPQLSSYVEDEALARAMSLARGLNFPTDAVADTTTAPTGLIRGQAPTARTPTYNPGGAAPTTAATNTGAASSAQWQRIMSGLASIVPLLFGKDAYGQFLNKGLIQSVKESLFGKDVAPTISDAALEKLVTSGVAPSSGGITYNPITGQPMGIDEGYTPGGLGDPYGAGSGWGDVPADPYGPGSGWGLDVPQDPWWTTPETSFDFSGLAGP